MIKKLIFASILLLTAIITNCQNGDDYQVYAIKYQQDTYGPVQSIAVGATANDSVLACYMVWLLKGENGRNYSAKKCIILLVKK